MIGTLLRPAYQEMGLKSENLARTIEDSGTTYDAFYPWSGGGIFAAGVLGVATLEYMPFMFFAFLSTFFSILVSLTQFKVRTIPPKDNEGEEKNKTAQAVPTSQSTDDTTPDSSNTVTVRAQDLGEEAATSRSPGSKSLPFSPPVAGATRP